VGEEAERRLSYLEENVNEWILERREGVYSSVLIIFNAILF
jgi:hypothetical protein